MMINKDLYLYKKGKGRNDGKEEISGYDHSNLCLHRGHCLFRTLETLHFPFFLPPLFYLIHNT